MTDEPTNVTPFPGKAASRAGADDTPEWTNDVFEYQLTDCKLVCIEENGLAESYDVGTCTVYEGRRLEWQGRGMERECTALFRYHMVIAAEGKELSDEDSSHEKQIDLRGMRGKEKLIFTGQAWPVFDDDGALIEMEFRHPPRIWVPTQGSTPPADIDGWDLD